jgi:hypothetical protein
MASITYRLNRPKDKSGELKKTPVPILISYYHQGLEIEDLSTGEKAIPSKWSNNRIKGDAGLQINKYLAELERTLLNAHLTYNASGQELEQIVRRIIKRQPATETESLQKKKSQRS